MANYLKEETNYICIVCWCSLQPNKSKLKKSSLFDKGENIYAPQPNKNISFNMEIEQIKGILT